MTEDDLPRHLRRERDRWRSAARVRPQWMAEPGPDQQSVWDYPRPPRIEHVEQELRVEFADLVIARTRRGVRICETSSPPAYYFPPDDVRRDLLMSEARTTVCEWKGVASYWSVRVGDRHAEQAVWAYPVPWRGFEAIGHYFAFNASLMDACHVGGERVRPQPGDYYGGWITSDLVGPFKGAPGTEHW